MNKLGIILGLVIIFSIMIGNIYNYEKYRKSLDSIISNNKDLIITNRY